jgi:hypothetical protein
MFRPTTFRVPPQPKTEIIPIHKFRGINQNVTPTQIHDSESPDMLNRVLDIKEATDTRFGYARIFPTSLGAGQINGMFQFKKQDGTKLFFIHWGTGLYTQSGSAQPVSIYTGLANAKSKYFTFANYCYIFDSVNFLRTDGVTTVDVSSVAYVPTLTLGRAPTGGGTPNENFNLIGKGFKDSFTAPSGTPTAYQLSVSGLDATAVTAIVNGVAKVETTDFTVNRTTGIVTFAVGPATGTANNVIITAYITLTSYANRIKQCTGFEIYGGTNDTRVFGFGNASFPNRLPRCGLNDPTYWPELAYNLIGSDAGIIKGMKKQYSSAIIVKEPTPNDITAWKMNYNIDSNGVVTFQTVPLNSRFACVAADTLHLIENNPVFLSPNGAVRIEGTQVSDQRDIVRISDDINKSLLTEANLQNAIAVDYDKKYIIGVNNRCYIMDYRITYPDDNYKSPWLIWDNIPASCFLEIDSYLYFGSNVTGLVYRFNKAVDANPYTDDGTAINDYWKSKVYSYNDDEHLKTVIKTFFSLKPAIKTSADLYYITDKVISDLIVSARMDLFNYFYWDYSHFSYLLSSLPQEVASKVKAKKIDYFQMILKNPRNNESMGILSTAFKVQQNREYK